MEQKLESMRIINDRVTSDVFPSISFDFTFCFSLIFRLYRTRRIDFLLITSSNAEICLILRK